MRLWHPAERFLMNGAEHVTPVIEVPQSSCRLRTEPSKSAAGESLVSLEVAFAFCEKVSCAICWSARRIGVWCR